jgi:hypothetical protein
MKLVFIRRWEREKLKVKSWGIEVFNITIKVNDKVTIQGKRALIKNIEKYVRTS